MPIAVHLIVGVICGTIAAAIASGKGRNTAGWFFGGFFLGLIGVIIVACMSNLKTERAYRRQIESEAHRLREQLRQERLKSESYRQYSMGRLDTHDQVLGVDTRGAGMLPGGPAPAQLPAGQVPLEEDSASALQRMAGGPAQPGRPQPVAGGFRQSGYQAPAPQPPDTETAWYYEQGGQARGPVPAVEVYGMLQDRTISARTLVWTEGMADWAFVQDIPIFRAAVSP